LENAAFAAHPSVLAPGGAANGGTRFGKSYWNLIWGIPVVLVYLFCYTAPVWGAAAISVSRFQTYQQDPEQRIPLSGIMFIFVLALLLVNFVRWVSWALAWRSGHASRARTRAPRLCRATSSSC